MLQCARCSRGRPPAVYHHRPQCSRRGRGTSQWPPSNPRAKAAPGLELERRRGDHAAQISAFEPVFDLDALLSRDRTVMGLHQLLSRKPVQFGREAFGIRQKDIDAKRQTPPTPEQFKRLRKHMNEEDSASLGVGVLHYVYAEQRAEFERQKSRTRLKERPVDEDDLLDVHARLEREISEFMERSDARI